MRRAHSRRWFLKNISVAGGSLVAWPFATRFARSLTSPFPGKFQPTWDSLSSYQVPEWYRNAKFGIFLHWGVYSVPAHANEWYPRLMYRRESPVFEWHREHWGPQSMFGYKDFIPLFRAERWKPDEWVDLFKRAGAKYIVPVGEHHDGFPMYDSHLTEWTAVRMGPHRDVVGELAREVRNQGLKLGISSHRGFNWSYYTFEKDFDTDNPRYSGLYGKIHAPTPLVSNEHGELRQTASQGFLEDWYSRCVEMVDLYRPDLFYFDWAMGAPEFEPYRRQFLAYFYNASDHWGKEVVLNYKLKAYPEHAAVLDIERGLVGDIRELPWQTDTSVSWKSWGYIENDSYKTPDQILHEFIDIVSKNGNLLLNVGPKPDGTIPDDAITLFRSLGRWMDINGEAIFGTRPWKVYGEGPHRLGAGSFGEKRGVTFTSEDVRFTQKGRTIYAILLGWPEREARIKSLGLGSSSSPGKISEVTLLGSNESLKWRQMPDALVIQTPARKPGDYAYVFKVTV